MKTPIKITCPIGSPDDRLFNQVNLLGAGHCKYSQVGHRSCYSFYNKRALLACLWSMEIEQAELWANDIEQTYPDKKVGAK